MEASGDMQAQQQMEAEALDVRAAFELRPVGRVADRLEELAERYPASRARLRGYVKRLRRAGGR